MRPLMWGDGTKWGDKNARWGSPSYVLEPGDPGYQPPDDPPPGNQVMSQDNKIAVTISAADKTAILQKIAELAALMPWRVNIPAAEKNKYTRIGVERAGMDQVFADLMAAHPEIVPSYVSPAEIQQDLAFRQDWSEIRAALAPLLEGGDDAALLANSDCYNNYSAVKHTVDAAANRSVPGMDTAKASIDVFFPGKRRKTTPTPPTPPA